MKAIVSKEAGTTRDRVYEYVDYGKKRFLVIDTAGVESVEKENTIEYLEPHGELDHGGYNIFLEYGPVADKSFRIYLKDKYRDLKTVSERWFGKPDKLKSWDNVRVPEIAAFLGWNKKAIDLTGKWKIAYPEGKDSSSWHKKDFNDSSWPVVNAPGHDRTM